MNNHPPTLPITEDNVLEFDSTSLGDFMQCPRQSLYRFIYKRVLSTERPALIFGGAVHAGLAMRYNQLAVDPLLTNERLDEQIKYMCDEFEARGGPAVDDYRTPQYATEFLQFYHKENSPTDPFRPIVDNGRPLVEVPFATPLGEIAVGTTILTPQGERHVDTIKVVWIGKIDLICMYEQRKMVVDHKTTSQLGSTYFYEYENSSQMMGYVYAAQRAFPDVVGMVVNALGIRKPTRTGKGFEIQRMSFFYPKERLEEWVVNTMTIISDFVSNFLRGEFPMHTTWCVGKYGQCSYLQVDTLPPSQRETLLFSNVYTEHTWSPLK